MKHLARLLVAAILLLTAAPVLAQTLPAHAVAIGRGAGVQGFSAAIAGASGTVFLGNGTTTDPAFIALSQDCTIASTGIITCTKTNNVPFTTAATTAIGTSGAKIPLLNGANIWSSDQTISKANPSFILNKNSSTQQTAIYGKTAGVTRWLVELGNTQAESGANAGSNFAITGYDDGGAVINTPLFISRSTGAVTLAVDLALTEGGTGASTASDARTNLGLGTAAVINTGTTSGTLQLLNADGGLTSSYGTATQTVQHIPFGGNYNNGGASFAEQLTFTGTTTGPKYAHSIAVKTQGGNANGSDLAAYALHLNATKGDGTDTYLTTTADGELAGLAIDATGGRKGDLDGILIGTYKVFGTGTDTGNGIGIEASTNAVNTSGTVTSDHHSLVGFQLVTGTVAGRSAVGFLSESQIGTSYASYMAWAGTDLGANTTYYFVGSTTRAGPANFTVASVDGSIVSGGTITANTVNTTTGYYVAGTQVVGARVTGWTAGTGTPNKGAFAAYAGQTLTVSYVQATMQATDDAAKDASQRVLALEQSLRTQGLIN